MKASVVVLSHDSGETIDRCLESLLAQRGVEDFEVVVIDNASSDESCDRIEQRFGAEPRLQIVRSQINLGCARGRNLGIEISHGDRLSFVDSDSVAAPDWLRATLDAFEAPDVGIVACKQVYGRNPRVLNGLGGVMNWQGYAWDTAFGEPAEFTLLPNEALFASGNGLSTRKEVVDRIGGFDELLWNYYEDVDFCLRARRTGFRLALAPQAVLKHYLGKPREVSRTKRQLCERNRLRIVLRHYPVRWLGRWLAAEWRLLARTDRTVPPADRLLAWYWTLSRLPGVITWRLRHGRRLAPFNVDALCEPYWGYGMHRGYNLQLTPDETRLSASIAMENCEEPGLLYGWYDPERMRGQWIRWSDGMAACVLQAPRPSCRIELQYAWPDAETAAAGGDLYIVSRQNSVVSRAALPPQAPFELTRVEFLLLEPLYTAEVILQTRRPLMKEEGPLVRQLGVGVVAIGFA